MFRWVVWTPAKAKTTNPQTFWRTYGAHQVTWSISGLIMAIPIIVLGKKWLFSDPEAELGAFQPANSPDPLAGDPLANVAAFDKFLGELTKVPPSK